MTVFFSQLINGLSLGSIYALIALGYSMVYSIILLRTLPRRRHHGGRVHILVRHDPAGPRPVTAVCATISHLYAAKRGHRKIATPGCAAHPASLLISHRRVVLLEYTAELVMVRAQRSSRLISDNKTFHLGKVPLGSTLHHHAGGHCAVHAGADLPRPEDRAWQGHARRSRIWTLPGLMGINVNSTISFTFAVGSALAGIGSVLYCCLTCRLPPPWAPRWA